MQYLDKFPEYIKKRRTKLGISLNSFSWKNGIEPATLSRYENGKHSFSFEGVIKLAKAFGQTPAEFLADFEKDCL